MFAPGVRLHLYALLPLLCDTGVAATWNVDQTGGGDFIAIQAAIDFAYDGDVIELEPATYFGGTIIDNKNITLRGLAGSASTFMVSNGTTETLEINDAVVTLEGLTLDGADGDRPLVVLGSDVDITDVIFMNGTSPDGAGGMSLQISNSVVSVVEAEFLSSVWVPEEIDGGHIAVDGSTLMATNVQFANGNATLGGAIAAMNFSSLDLVDCQFANNSADSGGAIHVDRGTTVAVNACTFSGNQAFDFGGALSLDTSADTSIDSSVFIGNTASLAGGHVYALDSDLQVDFSEFIAGASGDSVGGAIYAGAPSIPGSIHIDGSSFVGNEAEVDGGAVYLDGIEMYRFIKSDFCGNRAVDDGGAIQLSSSGSLGPASNFIEGTVFNGNVAGDKGGAVNCSGLSYMDLINNTLVGNENDASMPAVRVNYGCQASVVNNLFAYSSGVALEMQAATDVRYNLLWENAGGQVNGGAPDATDLVDLDPLLVAYTYDGACNDDLSLGVYSPAIDAGDPEIVDIYNGTRSDIGATGGQYGREDLGLGGGPETEPTDTDVPTEEPTVPTEGPSAFRPGAHDVVPSGWFCNAGGSVPTTFFAFFGCLLAASARRYR